jgi:hypothetical protein
VRGLHDLAFAGTAGVARAAGHQHPEACRDHIEALGHVFADAVQGAAAAGALLAVDVEQLLDALEMRRQLAAVGAALLLGAGADRTGGIELGFDLGDGDTEIFHRQLELVVVELLRTGAETVPHEGGDDAAQPRDLGIRFSLGNGVVLGFGIDALYLRRRVLYLRHKPCRLCAGGDDHGAEHLGIIGEIGLGEHDGCSETQFGEANHARARASRASEKLSQFIAGTAR